MIYQLTLDERVSRKIYFSNKIIHELTYSYLSNKYKTKINKIKTFCLATNGCSATNAIRPPPMSHTSNNYYYFFGV